jgi:hypothetical protein
MRKLVPLEDRFWQKVDTSGDCWLWTASSNGRYGKIGNHRDGRKVLLYAHRVAWELHNGPIPEGMVICHTCDTPLCVRIDHLFLGTYSDNTHDAMAKKRMYPVAPTPGESHPKAKLNYQAVREIRASTESSRVLGARYGVTQGTISKVKTGRTWAE